MAQEPSRAAGTETYEIACRDDAFGVVQIGCVCLALWRGEVTPLRFRLQHTELLHAVSRHREGTAFICMVEPGAPPPSAQMRKVSIDMINELGPRLRCIACVIEGNGFRAAATRSALSGMSLLLSSRTASLKFTATLQEAAPWVAKHCEGVTREAILDGHLQLRQRLTRGAP